MRNFFSVTALAVVTMLLAACGGDAFQGTSSSTSGGGGTTNAVASVSVSSSTATIPANGSSTATISAVAKNSAGTGVSGIAITFTASAGTITTVSGTTDSTGTATATLATGSAAAGSSITVTAADGTITGQTTVTVGTTQATVSLTTSSPQIPSDGTSGATITALIRDVNNNVVPNVQVTFAATSGGIAPNAPSGVTGGTPGETGSNGQATAQLTTAGDPTDRTVTVTATQGTASSTITVDVVGTTLTISGPASLVQGNQGTYTVSLANSSKGAIPNQTVTVASSAGNTLSATSLMTDASGNAVFTLTATKSGADTVSAKALALTTSQDVSVSNQVFGITVPAANATINLGATQPVNVTWTSNGAPVANQPVTFAATRGTLSAQSATTNAQGVATVNISSNSGGPAIISATGTGVSATQNVIFVATAPNSISVQASPASISINGQSTITAIVRDVNNNLVEGQTVNFQLTDVTGGQLSFATATTDVEGVAQTVYTATSTPSTSNGVSVTATVQNTAITGMASLTVGGQTVFVKLNTGNTVSENANKTEFLMPWSVQTVDSAGHPVSNVPITLTVHSQRYITTPAPIDAYWKGTYHVCGTSWVQYNNNGGPDPGCATAAPIVGCLNEDQNLTGIYDPAEDFNHNGKLDPGDVAVAVPGTLTTGSDGSAQFTVNYGEDYALWVQVNLTATATVQGTESTDEATFILPMLAIYLTTTTASPPGFISPYGTANNCANPN